MRVRVLACVALSLAPAGCHVYNAALLDTSTDGIVVDGSDAIASDSRDATGADVIATDGDACATACGAECVDLQTDPRHCGSCDTDCTALPNVLGDAVRCVAGTCDYASACAPGHAHCSAN